MIQVNMLDAKTNLSKLIAMLEDGSESAITIARNGNAVARLTLCPEAVKKPRIGVLKGRFEWPEEFDEWDQEIAEMFEVE